MIPNCIKLDDRQKAKLIRFVKHIEQSFTEDDLLEALEEDCVVTSLLTFEITSTGLGDNITVRSMGKRCSLSIDDDNEIIPDEWHRKVLP